MPKLLNHKIIKLINMDMEQEQEQDPTTADVSKKCTSFITHIDNIEELAHKVPENEVLIFRFTDSENIDHDSCYSGTMPIHIVKDMCNHLNYPLLRTIIQNYTPHKYTIILTIVHMDTQNPADIYTKVATLQKKKTKNGENDDDVEDNTNNNKDDTYILYMDECPNL